MNVESEMDKAVRELEEMREREAEEKRKALYESINFPKAQKWSELKQQNFGKIRWRINNLIPLEGFVILAAVSGDRKTWVALEIAKAISLGIPFVGNKDFYCEEGAVLYIDSEMPKSELQRRARLLGLDDSKNDILFLNRSDLNLNDDERVEQLIEYIKTNNIKVVIVDTLRASAGGLKEEKAEDVRAYFNRYKPLKDMGVAVIFLDHFRKPNHFEGKVPKKEHLFSSQDKTACVEVLLMLQTDEGGNEIKVYQRKNRLTKEVEPFIIKMDDILDEAFNLERIELSYKGLIEESETKKEEAMEYITIILKQGGMTTKQIVRQINIDKKIGEKNTREALKELVTLNFIKLEKKGKENFYSLEKTLDPIDRAILLGKTPSVSDDGGKNERS